MNKPEVQIIIPLYNAQDYISFCLDSLKSQTFENWQAIIVDDASSDGGADIVKQYAETDSRFVYIRQEKNGGVATVRNVALSKLTAKYTAFLDSDDYWEKDMLSVLVENAKKYDCDVCQCRYIYDYPGGKQVAPPGAFKEDTFCSGKSLRRVYRKMMTGINMNHVCMKLIKTELISNLKFDTELKTAEDLQFCIKMFHHVKTYCFVNKILYHYRRSENSLTGKGLSGKEKLKANKKVSQDLLGALPLWGIDNLFYRFLSVARPYIIIVSKIVRIFKEKFFSKN